MKTPRTGPKQTKPIPLRLSEEMVEEIKEVAKLVGLDQANTMRIAMLIGLKVLRKLKSDGVGELLATAYR